MDDFTKLTQSFGGDSIVTIRLEDSDKTFTVSKALLCNASEYFQKALQGHFMEAQLQTLTVPGCSTEAFKLLLFYIAKKELPTITCAYPDWSSDPHVQEEIQCALFGLWITAGVLLMPHLQNLAQKCLVQFRTSMHVNVKALELGFSGTAADSSLRRILAMWVIVDWKYLVKDETVTDRLGRVSGLLSQILQEVQKAVTQRKIVLKFLQAESDENEEPEE